MNTSSDVVGVERGRDADLGAAKKGRGRSKSRDIVSSMETQVVKVELAVADAMERLDRLEQGVDMLDGRVDDQMEELRRSTQSTNESNAEAWHENRAFQARVLDFMAQMQAQMEEFKKSLEETREDWALCKRAATSAIPTQQMGYCPMVDVPKPKEFSGKRDAKELDNYMWHMERYFEALNFQDEKQKVNTATLYLSNLAATWWRRKHEEIKRGTCTINSWEELRSELKRQFYPVNVVHEARKRMKELKHQRSIREYVEEFSGLMLQIPNMSEEDLLFNFMDGLQSWASQELQRRGVRDISTALTIAETLIDYRKGESSNSKPISNHVDSGGDKFRRPQNGEYKKPHFNKDWRKNGKDETKPKLKCFLCDGPHWARECPKRKALSAMLEKKEIEEQALNAMLKKREIEEQPQLGGLQLLNALKASSTPVANKADKSLMYVAARINGKDTQVMIDTGASHNFIKREEAIWLGLKVEKGQGWLKAVNAEAKPLDGVARGVELHMSTWKGKVNFSIAPLDNFTIVLGMEFLREFNVVPLPLYNTMCILEGGPYMIPTVGKPSTSKQLSSLQLKEGIEKGEDICPTTLCKGKDEASSMERPKEGHQVPEKLKNVMPPKLSKKLPPRRKVDRAIIVEADAKPSGRAPHCMSPPGAKRRQWEKKVENPQRRYGNSRSGSNKKGRRGRRRHRWGRMSRPWRFDKHLVGDTSLAFDRALGEHSPPFGRSEEHSRGLWKDPEFSRTSWKAMENT